jgi:hypothetical protein
MKTNERDFCLLFSLKIFSLRFFFIKFCNAHKNFEFNSHSFKNRERESLKEKKVFLTLSLQISAIFANALRDFFPASVLPLHDIHIRYRSDQSLSMQAKFIQIRNLSERIRPRHINVRK